MTKLAVFMLATAPYQVAIVWATCWLVLDSLRERRAARMAASQARLHLLRINENVDHDVCKPNPNDTNDSPSGPARQHPQDRHTEHAHPHHSGTATARSRPARHRDHCTNPNPLS